MKQSRTYTIAITALTIEALIIIVAALVMFLAPDLFVVWADLASTIALSVAGLGGAGSGSMALRDYGSGGLTSCQSGDVIAPRGLQPPADDAP